MVKPAQQNSSIRLSTNARISLDLFQYLTNHVVGDMLVNSAVLVVTLSISRIYRHSLCEVLIEMRLCAYIRRGLHL
jgi:hypothetical protein